MYFELSDGHSGRILMFRPDNNEQWHPKNNISFENRTKHDQIPNTIISHWQLFGWWRFEDDFWANGLLNTNKIECDSNAIIIESTLNICTTFNTKRREKKNCRKVRNSFKTPTFSKNTRFSVYIDELPNTREKDELFVHLQIIKNFFHSFYDFSHSLLLLLRIFI